MAWLRTNASELHSTRPAPPRTSHNLPLGRPATRGSPTRPEDPNPTRLRSLSTTPWPPPGPLPRPRRPAPTGLVPIRLQDRGHTPGTLAQPRSLQGPGPPQPYRSGSPTGPGTSRPLPVRRCHLLFAVRAAKSSSYWPCYCPHHPPALLHAGPAATLKALGLLDACPEAPQDPGVPPVMWPVPPPGPPEARRRTTWRMPRATLRPCPRWRSWGVPESIVRHVLDSGEWSLAGRRGSGRPKSPEDPTHQSSASNLGFSTPCGPARGHLWRQGMGDSETVRKPGSSTPSRAPWLQLKPCPTPSRPLCRFTPLDAFLLMPPRPPSVPLAPGRAPFIPTCRSPDPRTRSLSAGEVPNRGLTPTG